MVRTFNFETYPKTALFVFKIASLAEKFNHHPDIEFKHNNVKIVYTTRDSGGVTEKDFEIAKEINRLYERFDASSKD